MGDAGFSGAIFNEKKSASNNSLVKNKFQHK